MENNSTLVSTLNKVFGNKKFLQTIIENNAIFDANLFEARLSKVLCYYIATRDTNTSYTYAEIEAKFDEIANKPMSDKQLRENVIDNGFLTHSFNGYKKSRIEKYGIDYFKKLNLREKNATRSIRRDLNFLEQEIEKSKFLVNQPQENEIFICSPGTKTIFYSCQNAPERLYRGPLHQEEGKELPIVLGETKESYYFRVIEKKIHSKYEDRNSEEYKKAIEAAKRVVEYYCSKSPSFALLDISKLKKMHVNTVYFNENSSYELQEFISNQTMGKVKDFFSRDERDYTERNNMGDLSTLSTYIPKDAVSGIVDIIDYFDLKQLFARMRGRKEGELIDYNTCEYRGIADLEMIGNIVPNMKTNNQLDALNDTFNLSREACNKSLEQLQERILARYKTINPKDLVSRKKVLQAKEEGILARDYVKRQGAKTEYTLRDMLKKLKDEGGLSTILDRDLEIKQDDMQYNSSIHGALHTRRVSFLAAAIMNLEKYQDTYDRDLIFESIKHHDIGRENDEEDELHGKKSTIKLIMNEERLARFDEEERQFIQFLITHHSIGSMRNSYDLLQLPRDVRGRYWKALDILKDADKLDRVRLDPYGEYLHEGLDPERLALHSSKKIEGLAYETYDKLIEILDIEEEIYDIDTYFSLLQQRKGIEEKEKQIEAQREKCKEGASGFLNGIIQNSKTQVRFSRFDRIIQRSGELLKEIIKGKDEGR